MEIAMILAVWVVMLVICDLVGVVMGVTSPMDKGWIDVIDDE